MKYAVTYEANGGEGTAPASASYAAGETFTVGKNSFTRDGYFFKGWNDGTKDVAAGSTYTMPAKDVKFQAQWEKAVPQLYGMWSGTYEDYYSHEIKSIEFIIFEGNEDYGIYIGICGGSSMIDLEEYQGIALAWFGGKAVEKIPGLYICRAGGVLWSESDKTLKYVSYADDNNLITHSMTYSPIPVFEEQTIPDGTYTEKDGNGPPVIINGEKFTICYSDLLEEGMVLHIGNYMVSAGIGRDPDGNILLEGYTLLQTDDGFMYWTGVVPEAGEFTYFVKEAASD